MQGAATDTGACEKNIPLMRAFALQCSGRNCKLHTLVRCSESSSSHPFSEGVLPFADTGIIDSFLLLGAGGGVSRPRLPAQPRAVRTCLHREVGERCRRPGQWTALCPHARASGRKTPVARGLARSGELAGTARLLEVSDVGWVRIPQTARRAPRALRGNLQKLGPGPGRWLAVRGVAGGEGGSSSALSRSASVRFCGCRVFGLKQEADEGVQVCVGADRCR